MSDSGGNQFTSANAFGLFDRFDEASHSYPVGLKELPENTFHLNARHNAWENR
jgi:hypothetical protein